MASSLQATIGSVANGVVAGAIAPLVMHSALGLSIASIALMSIGLVAWRIVRTRWPQTGIDPPAAP
jgi:DHA1 family bicyclomycin/chloramphenicol resistance-like MFS transporter